MGPLSFVEMFVGVASVPPRKVLDPNEVTATIAAVVRPRTALTATA